MVSYYPTNINNYSSTIIKPSYLTKSLALINKYKIDGNTPIRDYLDNLSNEDLKSLKKKNIMFMDQITTPDGQYLLTWEEAKRNNLI